MFFSIWWEKNNKTSNSLLHAYKESLIHVLGISSTLIPVLSTEGLNWGSLAITRAFTLLRWLLWVRPAQVRWPWGGPEGHAPDPLPHHQGSALPASVRPLSALSPIPAVPKPGWVLKPQPPSSEGLTAASRKFFLHDEHPPHPSETTHSSRVKNVPPWDSS